MSARFRPETFSAVLTRARLKRETHERARLHGMSTRTTRKGAHAEQKEKGGSARGGGAHARDARAACRRGAAAAAAPAAAAAEASLRCPLSGCVCVPGEARARARTPKCARERGQKSAAAVVTCFVRKHKLNLKGPGRGDGYFAARPSSLGGSETRLFTCASCAVARDASSSSPCVCVSNPPPPPPSRCAEAGRKEGAAAAPPPPRERERERGCACRAMHNSLEDDRRRLHVLLDLLVRQHRRAVEVDLRLRGW